MMIKLYIAKYLIVLGFLLNISNYGLVLINFYNDDNQTSIAIEESESSEQKEKESSEKEDLKEKDKISQNNDDRVSSLIDSVDSFYPDLFNPNSSVYLEKNTPPPEFS